MKNFKISTFYFVSLFLLFIQNKNLAQEQIFNIDGTNYIYNKPNFFDFILKAPSEFSEFTNSAFQKKYILPDILICSTTALFIIQDQNIYNKVSSIGRKWGIGNEDNTKTYISVGNYPLLRGPSDFGSAMYFIGDGWTHLGIGVGFLTAGLINNDNRALQTASEIMEGIVTVGITTQLLKHITGRETPSRATQDGGVWRFFPNQKKYSKEVPNYDAYPSGHLAVAMMTVTVISNNYEEYKWIRPVGYGLMTLLAFQMINNGVHWMSDYPLALGIGYLFGKIAVNAGRKKMVNDNYQLPSKLSFYPIIGPNKSLFLAINYQL